MLRQISHRGSMGSAPPPNPQRARPVATAQAAATSRKKVRGEDLMENFLDFDFDMFARTPFEIKDLGGERPKRRRRRRSHIRPMLHMVIS